jgi:hypothetical protein
MKRLAFVMLIIALLLVGITLLLNTCDRGSGEPSVSDARYQITADNRVYYTSDYTQGVDKYGQYIVLQGYWVKNDSSWTYKNSNYYLSYKGYKDIQITKR